MRGDRIAALAVLAVLGHASAQPINVPPVPEPSCQCGPNGEWVKCTQCSSGDSTEQPGKRATGPQQVPPLFKVVAGAVVLVGAAIAPAHVASGFTKTQSAQQARDAWNDEQKRRAALERADRMARQLGGALDGSVRIATTAPAVRVQGYSVVASPPPPDPWSPGGACAQILVANDAALERARVRAEANARSQLPTVQDLVKQAKSASLKLVAGKLGAQKALAQGKALQADLKRAKEMQAYLDEVTRCLETKDLHPDDPCERLIYERTNKELAAFLDELQPGTSDAHERVRKASVFYRSYVSDLERDIERQAALTARCR